MTDGDMNRTAALVIRVWEEDDEGFRARLTGLPLHEDPAGPGEITLAVAATPSDVIDAVRVWLHDFTGGRGTAD
jgi:hypothetical protein